MRKILFNFIFLLFQVNSAMASNFDTKIRGIILDSLSQSPIENASIHLISENKNVKTVLSKYDGSFSFSVEENENYRLTISHIGYKTQYIQINVNGENLPDLKIQFQLDEVDLKAVTIKANKPLVSQKNGEIAYHIEGGIWQNSGNALSVINRIPILKGRSGSNYLLYGTKVIFLIDGKPAESMGVSLEAVLSNLGTGEIDKVEILQSPPPNLARFGKPIVNIKTIKMKEDGSLLNMSHGYGRGQNNRFNNGIKYGLKEGNLLLGLSLSQSQINQVSKINSSKIAPQFNFSDASNLKNRTDLYNVKLTSGYSSKNLGAINFSFDHRNTNFSTKNTSIGQYEFLDKTDYLTLMSNTKAIGTQDIVGLDYSRKISNYFNILSSIEIGQYDIDNKEDISLERVLESQNFTNPWSRDIVFKNFYLENESKFGGTKLTAGLFYKTSESKTKYIQNVGTNANTNNNFTYSENILSTFISSNYAKGKTDLTIGLNLEHTDIEGFSFTNKKYVDFYSLLPSLAYNYQISDSKSINLSYSRGINRPEYEWLNQQELYKNPYNKHIGGGVLLPTIFNKISVSSSFANGLTLTGIYSHQKNRYSFYPLVSGNQVNFSAININKFYYLYYSASFQKYLTNIWYFATDISGYYSDLKSTDYGIKNSGYTQQFSVSNYLTFKKLGQFGLTSSYNTTDYADSYQFLPQFSLNLEYSKSILKNNGSVNISLSDITNSLRNRYRYNLGNFSVNDAYKFETRLLKLALNYKLGNKNVRNTSPRNSKSESEIERLK